MPPVPQKQTPPTTPSRTPTTKSGSVLDRIAPVSFEDAGLKMLIYGASGSGKTTFWATFPGPILAVVCSGGNKPGELRSLTQEQRKKTKTVALRASSELSQIVEHVEKTGAFNTVVLDHASGLSDLILKEILGLKELPAQLSWGLASQQQYGQLALQCKERFRELLNLRGNVVIIAQERVFNSKDDGADSDIIKPTVGAALTPSVTGWLNPACDYVVQTFKRPKMVARTTSIGGKDHVTYDRGKGVEYCLRVEPHDVFITKFRVPGGIKEDVIVNPTYDKVRKIIGEG